MTSNKEILQKDHETVIGKIIYLSEKEDRQGEERGREYFIINKHANCLLYTSDAADEL